MNQQKRSEGVSINLYTSDLCIIMATLQCTKCSHTFEKDKIPLVCPFCGTKDSVRKVPSACQILSDVRHEEQSFISRQKKN